MLSDIRKMKPMVFSTDREHFPQSDDERTRLKDKSLKSCSLTVIL